MDLFCSHISRSHCNFEGLEKLEIDSVSQSSDKFSPRRSPGPQDRVEGVLLEDNILDKILQIIERIKIVHREPYPNRSEPNLILVSRGTINIDAIRYLNEPFTRDASNL